MKKIYLALLALTLGVSAQAQRNIKLQFDIESPMLDTNLKPANNVYFKYKVTNMSATVADSLIVGDTLNFFHPFSLYSKDTLRTYFKLGIPSTIPKGGSFSAIGTGKVSDIQVLLDGTTLKTTNTFVNNKQYFWFYSLYQITYKKTGLTVISLDANVDTQRVWYNKGLTGINEVAGDDVKIKTYPNPAANQLSFDFDVPANDKATATIMDAAGRTVMVKELDNTTTKHNLDISTISTGMYMLHLSVGDKVATTKFNVQK